jgi:hypothetical protein
MLKFNNNVLIITLTAMLLVLVSVLYVFTHNIGISLLIILGYVLAVMDTSTGMGFGTIGTPTLLIVGVASTVAVPAILISQFAADSLGSISHRRLKNVDVLNLKNNDGKVALVIVSMGLIGALMGVILAISLPKVYVSSYIGILVIVMGIILLAKLRFNFSWRTLFPISILSGFNKAISGGGYGPIVTTGLLISGNPIKNSVGIAVFSVAVINLFAFIIYLLSRSITSYLIVVAIIVGAILGSQIGPRITNKMVLKRDKKIIGAIIVILGILTLITTFIKF